MKIWLLVLMLLAAFAAGLAVHAAYLRAECPTEDSCVADYRDGTWYVEEVTP